MQKPLIYGPDGMPIGTPWDYGLSTLGDGCIAWAEMHLAQPDGKNAGDPWTFADWQERWLLWWYAVNPDTGAFIYDEGQLVLPKGTGKSPLGGAGANIELLGPVVLDHIDKHGNAFGVRHASPTVAIIAKTEEQTRNTLALAAKMLRLGPALDLIPDLEVAKTYLTTSTGEIIAHGLNSTTQEGKRLTAAFADETQHWLDNNGGTETEKTTRGNLTKMEGRLVQMTNAWASGQNSVAENTNDQVELEAAGKTAERFLLQMWRKAKPDVDVRDRAQVKEALEYLYEGCTWQNVDYLVRSFYKTTNTLEHSRRMFLNQVVSDDQQIVAPHAWAALITDDPLKPGDEVTLGFDGGKSDDATALIACRIRDRAFFKLGIWQKPKDWPADERWEVDKEKVDTRVSQAFTSYKVKAFFADVELWETYIDKWAREHGEHLTVSAGPGHRVKFDMRGRRKDTSDAFVRLSRGIEDGVVRHGGDPELTRHVLNARHCLDMRNNPSFGKPSKRSHAKIDGFAAMVAADAACAAHLDKGKKTKTGGSVSWG